MQRDQPRKPPPDQTPAFFTLSLLAGNLASVFAPSDIGSRLTGTGGRRNHAIAPPMPQRRSSLDVKVGGAFRQSIPRRQLASRCASIPSASPRFSRFTMRCLHRCLAPTGFSGQVPAANRPCCRGIWRPPCRASAGTRFHFVLHRHVSTLLVLSFEGHAGSPYHL